VNADVSAISQLVIAGSLTLLSLGSLTLVAKVAWGARGVVEQQTAHQRAVLEQVERMLKSLGDVTKLVNDIREERTQISISYGVLSEKYESMTERMSEIASAVNRTTRAAGG
jgi:predicted nuclease with TOPRIM domain